VHFGEDWSGVDVFAALIDQPKLVHVKNCSKHKGHNLILQPLNVGEF